MKTMILSALAMIALALSMMATPALAERINMKYVSQAALQSTCGKLGGDFLSNDKTYECTKPCGTGNCSVECDPAKKTCVGSTPPKQQRTAGNSPYDILGDLHAAPKVELEFSGTDGFGSRSHDNPAGGTYNYDIGQWHANSPGGGVILGGGIFASH
ncbi:MAG TPA: hypothetical protein VFE64_03770 [Devosia sp.]|jgi:hypothetical protein|nr:hypothetical protein [Devosia sp.]